MMKYIFDLRYNIIKIDYFVFAVSLWYKGNKKQLNFDLKYQRKIIKYLYCLEKSFPINTNGWKNKPFKNLY